MSKVTVINSIERRKADSSCSGPVTLYESWIPEDYTADDLKRDAAKYWHLQASTVEIRKEDDVFVPGFERVSSSSTLKQLTYLLDEASHTDDHMDLEGVVNKSISSRSDLSTVQDQIFGLFAISALLNPIRNNQLFVSKKQFKSILLRAGVFPSNCKFKFDTSVDLALRRGSFNGRCNTTAVTFDRFLDAIMDIATIRFPKLEPIEKALEKLLTQFLVPLYESELEFGKGYMTWRQLNLLLSGTLVQSVVHRFSKLLSDLAEVHSTSLSHISDTKRLTFHEFRCFLHELKPKSIQIPSAGLAKVFFYFLRRDLSLSHETMTNPAPNVVDMFNKTDGRNLSLKCSDTINVLSVLSWHIMVAKTKKAKPVDFDETIRNIPDKMRARVLKALLYNFAIQLREQTGGGAAKSAQYNIARSRFLDEFVRMHREDSMEDYHQMFLLYFTMQPIKQKRSGDVNGTLIIAEETLDANTGNNDHNTGDLSFLDEPSNITYEVELDRAATAQSTCIQETLSEENTKLENETYTRPRRQQSDFAVICNQADEMYAFLTSELLRITSEKRETIDNVLVEPMLDIWVAAGEKYSRAIESLDHFEGRKCVTKRAEAFARWGMSLEVFAMQVLKRTTRMGEYEAHFGVTNPRIFNVQSSLWGDIASLFSVDLAVESLSLASAKLSEAAEELATLLCSDDSFMDLAPSPDLDEDSDDSDSEGEQANSRSADYEKYLVYVFHRANCLVLYGDTISHGKQVTPDYQLGCALEEELGNDTNVRVESTIPSAFLTSDTVLTKSSSAGAFYDEARKMYTFLLRHTHHRGAASGGGTGATYSVALLLRNLGMVQFKLAALLPRGCVAETSLLNAALQNVSTINKARYECHTYQSGRTINYVRDIIAVRQSFFQAEVESTNIAPHNASPIRKPIESRNDSPDRIVPLYRFILAAAFRELDETNTGALSRAQIFKFNALMKCEDDPSDVSIDWLMTSFEASEHGITERGFFSYFCWLAEMDPGTFRKIMDDLSFRYTQTQPSGPSPKSNHPKHLQRAASLRPKALTESLLRSSSERCATALQNDSPRIADSIIILRGTLHSEAIANISHTNAPSEVRLEPEIVDLLPASANVPKEVSTFCFPDAIFLSTQWTTPHVLDVVLTDDKGSKLFASCLHFVEEQDPMDILALISSADRSGSKTTDLPSWISLRDIQHDSAKLRCFVPMCICVISAVPMFKTFQRFLVHLYRVMHTSNSLMCETPEALAYTFLQQICLPPDATSQTAFKLGDQACLISGRASNSAIFYPAEVEFQLVFQLLSAENIVKVYSFLLTEKKVVLCSKNKAVLTHVAETFRALLHPFEFQQVYIPLLPLALLDFVTAPVPFFMGIGSGIGVAELEAEGIVVVDLDKNEVATPTSEVLPSLPDSKVKKLVAGLRKVMQNGLQLDQLPNQNRSSNFGTIRASWLDPMPSTYKPTKPTDEELALLLQYHEDISDKWADFQSVFLAFNTRLIRNVRKFCFKAAGGSPRKVATSEQSRSVDFDNRAFLSSNQSMREFCGHLFQTQLFQRFLDNFDSITEQIEPDQTWRGVRSISSLRRHLGDSSSVGDDLQLQRSMLLVPLPPLPPPQSNCIRLVAGTSRQFDSSLFEELVLGNDQKLSPQLSKGPSTRKVSASESSSTIELTESFLGGEGSPSNLVSEAKKRLQEKRMLL